jgi:glycosyltransferase involved in cell wall biosynthesis
MHQEPFARVVLEALASGLAVVAAETGGTTEIIRHDETGLVFRPGDAQDLAVQMHRLIMEQGLRERLATCGQAEVLERFSLEHMVDSIEQLLQEAVIEARPSKD